MAPEELANCLEKLGNPTRLAIFRLLVQAGPDGMTVGALQSHLGVPASTLSHHVLFLATVRLIRQEREGRTLRCRANLPLMHEIVTALTAQCCAGVPPRNTTAPKNGGAAKVRQRAARPRRNQA
jgi:DNA-binding transcriptional ArsR family regulator